MTELSEDNVFPDCLIIRYMTIVLRRSSGYALGPDYRDMDEVAVWRTREEADKHITYSKRRGDLPLELHRIARQIGQGTETHVTVFGSENEEVQAVRDRRVAEVGRGLRQRRETCTYRDEFNNV